jgi:protease IV
MQDGPSQAGRPIERRQSGRRTASWVWVLMILGVGAGLGSTCVTCASMTRGVGGGLPFGRHDEVVKGGNDRVGVVEVLGPIMDAKNVVTHIRAFARRDDLIAIVVRIDSPGGSVAPSQEIYEALRYASGYKPVVASMGGVAASGGFWIAMGADWIVAAPGSITGSIGVITQTPDLQGLAELLRFKMRTFKSGPVKDAGNPFRPLTDEDREVFMGLIEDIFGQFLKTVADSRKMTLAQVRPHADGRIFSGLRAKELGFVDELGGLYAAAHRAVELAADRDGRVKTSTATADDPTLVYPREPMPDFFQLLAGGLAKSVGAGVTEGLRVGLGTTQEPAVVAR